MLQISNIEKINDFEDFDLVESTRSALVAFQAWLQLISKTLASFTYLWLMWAGTGGSIGGSSCRGLRWRHTHPARCQPNPAQDSTCGNRCAREGPSLWAGLQKKLIRPCLSQTGDRVLGQDRPLPTHFGYLMAAGVLLTCSTTNRLRLLACTSLEMHPAADFPKLAMLQIKRQRSVQTPLFGCWLDKHQTVRLSPTRPVIHQLLPLLRHG